MNIKDHVAGERECGACWMNHPKECECGGLIHAEFFEEMSDGYLLQYCCDRCGDNYSEKDES